METMIKIIKKKEKMNYLSLFRQKVSFSNCLNRKLHVDSTLRVHFSFPLIIFLGMRKNKMLKHLQTIKLKTVFLR